MVLDWARPGVLNITSHAYEFAALVAAARYVAEAAPADIPPEALRQLRGILDDYDTQMARLRDGAPG
ncbi:hypothetical protein [Streptomyces sp. PR69]|uniref:hypothetical protein n=1 Tax=Streptomyces sp. PR69 TaxID=2984950 RepID=UPI0022641E59|nr:hypothetical protein [Streptomyces sp. PR69]